MGSQTPLVLEGISLPDFIQYILKSHGTPSILIICSTKGSFLQQLHDSVATDADDDQDTGHPTQYQQWRNPTLRLLASCRTVKMVFCPELAHLRAYLAARAYRMSTEAEAESATSTSRQSYRTIAILNLIALHKPTSAFSAQGLSRTLAVAVEAAYYTNSRLVLAECPFAKPTTDYEDMSELPDMPIDGELHDATVLTSNLWDDEVSILNVTTKSFGAGERGWVGRTVSIRAVVGRWCVFQDMKTRVL